MHLPIIKFDCVNSHSTGVKLATKLVEQKAQVSVIDKVVFEKFRCGQNSDKTKKVNLKKVVKPLAGIFKSKDKN